jgi:hypothetical protein
MLDPISALENIYSVTKLIYAQVQLVKANQEQCKRLAERIGIIEQSVHNLDQITDKGQYEKGLNDLLAGLQNCLAFMTQLSAVASFKAFFKAGYYSQQFLNLNEELQKSIQQLNLGLVAQQVFNREQDKRDQQADIEFIKKNHQEIISEVQKGNAGIDQLSLELKENHDIVLNQFESMKAILMGLNLSAEKPLIDPHHVAPSYFESVDQKNIHDLPPALNLPPKPLPPGRVPTAVSVSRPSVVVSTRRGSGIKQFTKKDEKENTLDALKELRKFFVGQRDKGELSANLETYEKYLKMAHKNAELIYRQIDKEHILCVDGNELDAKAAAKAIWGMIQPLEQGNPPVSPTLVVPPPPNTPTGTRRASGIKSFTKENERENMLDSLKELRKFFVGQRDKGELSANLEIYEKYLKMAHKNAELIYRQIDKEHILCVDGDELDAKAAAKAIWEMIQRLENIAPQSTFLTNDLKFRLNDLHQNIPKPLSEGKASPPFIAAATPFVDSAQRGSKDLKEFLRLVARGEQIEAEAMLKLNHNLALIPGEVTDVSKRKFTNITGFQYAVWALDWHMWTMIRKYLTVKEAEQQAQGFETGPWVIQHGIHANWDNLIDALRITVSLYKQSNWKEGDKAWIERVGGAQLTLPAHVINEYCHPNRSFFPCPNFRDPSPLPRIRTIGEEWWFAAMYNGGSLGTAFAIYRGGQERVKPWWLSSDQAPGGLGAQRDYESVQELAIVRGAQRMELVTELRSKDVQMLRSLVSKSFPKAPVISTAEPALFVNPALASMPQAPSPNAAFVPKPNVREQKDPAMLPLFKEVAKPAPKVSTSDLKQFLKLVAEGEQDAAEAMLQRDPALAFLSGDLTDLSKRTFTGITGFQYAVWALDWHMWTMIKKYLPDSVAREQAQGFETGSWQKSHGIHANLNTLIQAYQTTIDLYNAKKYDEANTTWVRQVGGAQLLLPVHVINEYCHLTRPFNPLPNFKDAIVLPRVRAIDAGEWFTAVYASGKLGEKFACWRGASGMCGVAACVTGRVWTGGGFDAKCILEMAITRTTQREELIAKLGLKNVQRRAA